MAVVLFFGSSLNAKSLLSEKQVDIETDICYEIAGYYVDSLIANDNLVLDMEFLVDAYFETLGECQNEW